MTDARFYFDFGSPTTYLAWKRLPGLQHRAGVRFELVPILLGAIFKTSGNSSPIMVPAKAKWMMDDLQLWVQRDAIPFLLNPHFPVNTLKPMRGAIVAAQRRELEAYSDAMFDAMWRDGRNIADPGEIHAILLENGLDGDAYLSAMELDTVKAKLVANTEAACAAGLFGAPSFLIDGRLFFGQDRMEFVEQALAAAK